MSASAVGSEKQTALKRCLTAEDGLPGRELDPLAPEMALFFDVLLRGEGKRLLPRCSAVHRLLPDYVAGQ
jgi:hypothetical protein